ncbi:polyphosphate kinase [Amaricoccus macauensis]|uniref:Polyphosphate kinase n=1 Tax=Amaricoccus macauensis TaxID=57001 RepID=A0A840SVF2_9RHOB|nr:RNA degradosome polyphosphate kinase [Amaricoccus macauensis]MBB5223253.1 polyphosphate kinase [Amaricoccus macauensis]
MPDAPAEAVVNADFLNSTAGPGRAVPDLDITGAERFINRELSWLAFNWRVMAEAENPAVPLLERVRFLSISASNLDEFYSVRVAGLRGMLREGVTTASADGLSAGEQLKRINADARALMNRQQECLRVLNTLMRAEGIEFPSPSDLRIADIKALESHFFEQVFPILSPLAIDPAHPFPFIANGGFAMGLQLRRETDGEVLEALLPVPSQVARFVRLPDGPAGQLRYLPLEGLLEVFIDRLFPGYVMLGLCAFRVLRDSDLEVEEEAADLVREFETALKRRRRGEVILMTMTADAPADLREMIVGSIGVVSEEVVEISGLLGMADLAELTRIGRPDLLWPSFTPRMPERVQDFEGDIFAAIRQKDMLLHHPYETFDVVVRFLQQAARDPDVLAIKQTLYRTSRDSPIVAALCEAAEDGKSVTALVELKARFDEAANIRQSRRLERAGAQVVYGFIDWKTHAKISTVVRREGPDLVTYTHFGTGNYHPGTANIYTDLSLFTCDKPLGRDATKVFNYVTGYVRPSSLENLAISPHMIKPRILEGLEAEIEHAKAGRPAQVWIKLNAVTEPEVIDALYAASQAGVKIDMVIRGICGLRAGVKGLSENIRVKSIIGRFLEHSRILCFGNGYGLPSSEARVYISSADWMERNLNWRIETLVEITNQTVRAQILDQIMAANMADQAHSWVAQPDGNYAKQLPREGEELFSCHRFFMKNPSLSGRGRIGVRDVTRVVRRPDGSQVSDDIPQTS